MVLEKAVKTILVDLRPSLTSTHRSQPVRATYEVLYTHGRVPHCVAHSSYRIQTMRQRDREREREGRRERERERRKEREIRKKEEREKRENRQIEAHIVLFQPTDIRILSRKVMLIPNDNEMVY